MEADPLAGVAPGMAGTSHASLGTTTVVADALEESNKSILEDGPVAHADKPISNSGDCFDNW